MVDAVLRRTNSVMEWLGYLSAAADAAGLGDVLKTETEDQTEEQRRRRILLQQMKQAVSPLTGFGSAMPGMGKTY